MHGEVIKFMQTCERLISLTMTTGELSEDECDVINYYTNELHSKTAPFCEAKPQQSSGTHCT